MRLRHLLLPLAALAGAAIAVVPTVASGSSPPSTGSFTAVDYAWQADDSGGTQVTIAPGGTVSFSYPSGYSEHNADFGSGPHPTSCTQTAGANSGAVPPLPHQPTAAGWNGSCTFDTPGTYSFHCDLHPYMTGTVVVESTLPTTTTTGTTQTTTTRTTTTTTTTPPTGTTTTTTGTTSPTTTGTTTTTSGDGTTSPGNGATTTSSTPTSRPTSPFAGGPSKGIQLAAHQTGTSVRGLVRPSSSASGGRLEVDLLATRSALGQGRGRGLVRVGRMVRTALRAGALRFAIALDRAAIRALHRRHQLQLTVRISLAPPHGAGLSVARVVLLRA